MAGISTGAGNVLMAHCHLENGNCAKKVDKERGTHSYLIAISTKHITHDQPRTDCTTCMVQTWCLYNKCESGQVEVIEKDGSSRLSPSWSWMTWVERSVIEPGRAAFILPCDRVCNIGREHVGYLWVCSLWMPEQLSDQLMPHRISTSDCHMLGTLKRGRKDSKPRLVFSILWHSKAEVQKWIWDQNICCCWDMGNHTVCYGRCLNYVERHRTNVHILS
jgi:hypothetical protein